jgi:hypothetical protein
VACLATTAAPPSRGRAALVRDVFPTRVDPPPGFAGRNFCTEILVSADGRFLHSGNQRADNIAVFRVNRESGGLDFTGFYSAVGNPSMIVFLDLATVPLGRSAVRPA